MEQKVPSHLHTFQGRCRDGILFLFHRGKFLCRQFVRNYWILNSPGIAAFFLRCILEIGVLHIHKCEGVETYDILSNKYKFSLPLAHSPHRSGHLSTTQLSLQLGFAFSQNSSLSQHVPVIINDIFYALTLTSTLLGTLLDLYFFPKITVTYFACLLACRLDEIQGAIYTVAAPLLCIITHFCLPFYPMDEGKKI